MKILNMKIVRYPSLTWKGNESKSMWCRGYVPYNSIQMPKNPAGSVIPADSLERKCVTMIVRKISGKGLQIGKLPRTEKLEKRGAFLDSSQKNSEKGCFSIQTGYSENFHISISNSRE